VTLAVDQSEQQRQDALNVKGRIRRRDEDELLALAFLDLFWVEESAAEWSRLAPDPFKGLSQAQPASPDFPDVPEARATASAPAFDPRTLQFVRKLGDVIPGTDVRQAALNAIAKAQREMLRETTVMEFGAKEIEDWFIDMAARVKRLHVALAIVGAGGRLQMPPAQLVRTIEAIPADLAQVITLADSIAFHIGKLYRFAVDVETARHLADTTNAIETRVGLYGASAYGGFEMLRRVSAIANGFTFEENVLADAEHCQAEPGELPEDCPTQTAKGIVRIGTLVPVGRRLCAMHCLCRLKFSKV
jgi:hypothetical protein